MRNPKRVAVIGAGSMGSQAMWRLAARGAEVIGYDRYAPGHAAVRPGARPASSAPSTSANPATSRCCGSPTGCGTTSRRRPDSSLRRRSGCLVMGETASPSMRLLLAAGSTHGLDHEVLDREELARRYPQHRLPDGHTAVLDRRGAVIRPEASVQPAAARAEQLAARLRRYTPVREIAPAAGGGVHIVTDQGTDHVDTAVVTVGPGSTPCSRTCRARSTSAG